MGLLHTKSIFFFAMLLCIQTSLIAQNRFSQHPDSAIIHTEDIHLFWKVFDATSPSFNKNALQKDYLDAGSKGLKGFINMRIESGANLSKTIKKNLNYYQKIRQSSLSVDAKRDTLFAYFNSLKKLYPQAIFPDVYFVIGAINTGGTTFKDGLIIGAEMFGKESAEFKPRLHIDVLNLVVIHELIHFQQNYSKDNTLLAQCIKEGAADFLCELITGSHSNKEIYLYGNSHEKELWLEFQKNKQNLQWTPWLYYTKEKSRPKDLGYWMGYKIVQAYYEKMTDKKQAIYDILNIKDFNAFLKDSEYQAL